MSFMEGVIYLENSDFNDDLTLKSNVHKNKPSVVMIQRQSCSYCTQAKPAFKNLSDKSNGFNVYSIQLELEPELINRLRPLDPNMAGVPAYWGFNRQGKYVKTHSGGRDENSLLEFIGVL